MYAHILSSGCSPTSSLNCTLRNAATTKMNDCRNYTCIRKTQTNQSCGSAGGIKNFMPSRTSQFSSRSSYWMQGIRGRRRSNSHSTSSFQQLSMGEILISVQLYLLICWKSLWQTIVLISSAVCFRAVLQLAFSNLRRNSPHRSRRITPCVVPLQ